MSVFGLIDATTFISAFTDVKKVNNDSIDKINDSFLDFS